MVRKARARRKMTTSRNYAVGPKGYIAIRLGISQIVESKQAESVTASHHTLAKVEPRCGPLLVPL